MSDLDRMLERNRRRKRTIILVCGFAIFVIVVGIALWVSSG